MCIYGCGYGISEYDRYTKCIYVVLGSQRLMYEDLIVAAKLMLSTTQLRICCTFSGSISKLDLFNKIIKMLFFLFNDSYFV